jgi:hypothetical protein
MEMPPWSKLYTKAEHLWHLSSEQGWGRLRSLITITILITGHGKLLITITITII